MFLFLLFSRSMWHSFQTEASLLSACSLCNKIVQSLRKNITDISPEPNSECSEENSQNPYCKLISETIKTIKVKFQKKIPPFACAVIGPCVPPSSSQSGELCYPCRFAAANAMQYPPPSRNQFLRHLCQSSKSLLDKFCTAIENSPFYNTIEKSNNATSICQTNGFCTKLSKKSEKEDL